MSGKLTNILDQRGPIRTIGVVGMGYVGIPSAVLFAASPAFERVWGFQRDSPTSGYKIAMLNRGESPLKGDEPDLEKLLSEAVEAGKFQCTADFSRISGLDAVTVAIQTPFLRPENLEPDLSPLMEGLRSVGRFLRKGMLVVLESTVTPGTTTGLARGLLEEESGLVAGEDFALAHAPERVMVGCLIRNIREHDRVVGGINEPSTRRAMELYLPVLATGSIIPMSATAAEVTKTAENTFRDLQIAAVNQLALYCEAMGVNVYDVRAGIASLKGEGISRAILNPGAGVGGHCLTKDTYHLERGIGVLGGTLDFPNGEGSLYVHARHINDFMPVHMLHLTKMGLMRINKSILSAHIAVLGWAFMRNTDDARNPPAEVFRTRCLEEGAHVRVHDPYVAEYPGVSLSSDLSAVVNGADAIAIFTEHDHYRILDPREIREGCGTDHPVIIDGRNVIDPDRFIAEGFIYKGIGRGDKNSHPIT